MMGRIRERQALMSFAGTRNTTLHSHPQDPSSLFSPYLPPAHIPINVAFGVAFPQTA
jgi:hypothetical protein